MNNPFRVSEESKQERYKTHPEEFTPIDITNPFSGETHTYLEDNEERRQYEMVKEQELLDLIADTMKIIMRDLDSDQKVIEAAHTTAEEARKDLTVYSKFINGKIELSRKYQQKALVYQSAEFIVNDLDLFDYKEEY